MHKCHKCYCIPARDIVSQGMFEDDHNLRTMIKLRRKTRQSIIRQKYKKCKEALKLFALKEKMPLGDGHTANKRGTHGVVGTS